jgi:hypothetical protein
MEALLQITGFVTITSLAGFNIIAVYDRKGDLGGLETAGLSYLLGIGAVTIEMFVFGIFGAKFTMPDIVLPWVIFSAINIPLFKTRFIRNRPKSMVPRGLSLFEKIAASLLVFVVCYTFFTALMRPVESYDSVAIWSLKAKVIYLAQTLPPDFFKMIGEKFHGAHPDYPLLLPLSEVWFYTFVNSFNDYLVKVLFPLNFLAFLLVFYSFLKRAVSNRLFALIFTFLLASVRQFTNSATDGYADMQMAIYCSLTFLSIYLWTRDKKDAYFWTAVFSCAISIWTKNEGAVIFLGFITILLIHIAADRQAVRRAASYKMALVPVIVMGILFAAWLLFKNSMNIRNDVINMQTFATYNPLSIFKRLAAIIYEYQRQAFGVKYWNLSWIAFIILAILGRKRLFSEEYRYITVPIFLILASYTVVYFITPQDIDWHLRTTASRLMMHVLPLMVFYIALEVKRICEKDDIHR